MCCFGMMSKTYCSEIIRNGMCSLYYLYKKDCIHAEAEREMSGSGNKDEFHYTVNYTVTLEICKPKLGSVRNRGDKVH